MGFSDIRYPYFTHTRRVCYYFYAASRHSLTYHVLALYPNPLTRFMQFFVRIERQYTTQLYPSSTLFQWISPRQGFGSWEDIYMISKDEGTSFNSHSVSNGFPANELLRVKLLFLHVWINHCIGKNNIIYIYVTVWSKMSIGTNYHNTFLTCILTV